MGIFRNISRFLGAAIAVLVVAVSVSACGSTTGDSASGGSDGGGSKARPSVGVVAINLSLPIFVQMLEASNKVGPLYGVDFDWQSCDGSLEKEISLVEGFIAQKKDVIMIDPVNALALEDVVNRATDAGVQVVTMGNKVNGKANHNTLYPDYANWSQQARILGKTLGGKGKVLLLIGTVGNYVSDTRQAGFEETMAAEFPGIKVITQPTDWEDAKAASATQTVLLNNPDLAGVAGILDSLTLAAIKFVDQKGLDIPFVTNDGDELVYKYIDSGMILSDTMTHGYRIGAWNTAIGARLALGSKFAVDLYMPTYTIASEATAAKLKEYGLDVETITTAEATKIVHDYAVEFGPAKPDAEMTAPQE